MAGFHSMGTMAHDDLVCPPSVSAIIRLGAVWLYLRFTLSHRDVEDLLESGGLETP